MEKKALVVGCTNNIGRNICNLLESSNQILKLFGGLDNNFSGKETYDTYREVKDLPDISDEVIFIETPDVIIMTTFLSEIFEYAEKYKIPVVYIATELTVEEIVAIGHVSKHIPIFYHSTNSFSLGILIAEQAIQTAESLIDISVGYYTNMPDLK